MFQPLHSTSTTYWQVTDAERITAEVGLELIRISAGLETLYDIHRDKDQALNALQEYRLFKIKALH